ncbi:MAG: RHS domain-containing protein, partial [Desulfobacteraceae bacterium]|nr:RHS domain-containing protein [Desulfobacteraceae bacterium]
MKVGDEYFYYQTDHLGTPQKLTVGNGEVVWSAKYNSFGRAEVDDASTVENNL